MFGLHNFVLVVAEDVVESEPGGVDPPPSLEHELFECVYGVSPGYRVRDVDESEIIFLECEDAKTENSVLCEVHVGLLEVFALDIGVEC